MSVSQPASAHGAGVAVASVGTSREAARQRGCCGTTVGR